jgi:dihydroorotate dehydrogenase
MYKIILKPIFFLFSPETIHHLVFSSIKILYKIPGIPSIIRSILVVNDKKLERKVFGLTFKNPVGLAAGFDKDAKLFNELAGFGFGFIEIGTVTPLAQPGNDKPRMFRLKKDEALINRMGFNNEGSKAAAERLRKRSTDIIIGGNIGRNKLTTNENALLDYEKCFEDLFDVVDYFVVNVSSPNTPDLRELQDKAPLTELLNHIMKLNQLKRNPKPVLLKIAPDLSNFQLDNIIEIVSTTGINGIIATNTTIERKDLSSDSSLINQKGGLSGKPLTKRSTEVIRYLSEKSGRSFPIIGVGGIHSAADAIEKLNAGASLVQLYTGYIYEGPGLVKNINKEILKHENN